MTTMTTAVTTTTTTTTMMDPTTAGDSDGGGCPRLFQLMARFDSMGDAAYDQRHRNRARG